MAHNELYERIYKIIADTHLKNEEKVRLVWEIVETHIEKKIEEKTIKNFENQKPVLKLELKDELRTELATKEDVLLLREEMKGMEERILRYVDERFHYLDKKIDERFYKLDKKMTIGFIILIILYVITNPNAINFVKFLIGLK